MNLQENIQQLLDQYVRHNGRGNMIAANGVLVDIIKCLSAAIEVSQVKQTGQRCQGCVYSKSMNQQYPRLCMVCGHPEQIADNCQIPEDNHANVDAALYNPTRSRGRPRKQPL